MMTETFPAQVRSALLIAVRAGEAHLSSSERTRFKTLAWQVCPCTCGSGPDGEGHTSACLYGYSAEPRSMNARIETGARILHDAHGWDLEECREDMAAVLLAIEAEQHA